MNIFERTIAALSPRAAVSRMRYQLAAKMLDTQIRRYEAAGTGRRNKNWKRVTSSANTENDGASIKIRGRSRDLVQNNPWAAKAVQVIAANTVGIGIRCQPKSTNSGKLKKASQLWRDWAETTACDWEGINDLYGIQWLAMITAVRDGMALVRYRRGGGGTIPLMLQVLEADFLDTTKLTGDKGNRIVQGMELDQDGRVIAYWLYENHPGDLGWLGMLTRKSNRVPADQVARVYRQDRPGQLIGVSWLAPVMFPLHDLDEYEDAQLMKQKVSACFSAFIHDAAGSDDSPSSVDGTGNPLPEKLEPGAIELLPSGKDITFPSPPTVDGFSEFVRAVLHKIAAGIGITYEALSGDLSQTNFSSGRLGGMEFQRSIESWRWRMLIPQLCAPTWEQFAKAAILAGFDLSGVTAEHTPPRREFIDPTNDLKGMVAEIRSGLTSYSEAVRERGYDPETLLKEIADDAKRFDEMDLVLDCDPRKTTQQGQPRDKAPTTKAPADKGQGG